MQTPVHGGWHRSSALRLAEHGIYAPGPPKEVVVLAKEMVDSVLAGGARRVRQQGRRRLPVDNLERHCTEGRYGRMCYSSTLRTGAKQPMLVVGRH